MNNTLVWLRLEVDVKSHQPLRNHVPPSQIQRSCYPLCRWASPEVHRLWRLGSAWAVAEAGEPFPNFLTADLQALSVETNNIVERSNYENVNDKQGPRDGFCLISTWAHYSKSLLALANQVRCSWNKPWLFFHTLGAMTFSSGAFSSVPFSYFRENNNKKVMVLDFKAQQNQVDNHCENTGAKAGAHLQTQHPGCRWENVLFLPWAS